MASHTIPSATGVEYIPRDLPNDETQFSLRTRHLNVEDDRSIVASWASEIRALTEEQQERFLKEMPDGDLYKFANSIEEVITQRIKSSRTLQVAEWMTPLGQLVDMTKPFAESIQSAFPPAGLILGGISLLLTTTRKFVEYQESVILFLQNALTNLSILEKFKSTIPKTEEIQLLLIAIYGDLVEFLAKAVKPFLDKEGQDRITLVPIARSIWKPFDAGFGKLEKKLDSDLSALDRALVFHSREGQVASTILQQRTYGLLQGAEKRRMVSDLENEVKETAKEREDLRRGILHWIPHSSFDHIQDDKHSNSLPSTGGWLFDHADFRAWKGSAPSNLLWITGKAGSGKSHLAAHTIHNIRESCRTHNFQSVRDHGDKFHALAFIYCSASTNASKSSAPVPAILTLFGSILWQFYAQLPKGENVESISRRYSESNFDSLRRAEIKNGIQDIVRKFTQTYIVIDGLDECSGLPGDDFKDLCQFFGSLATQQSASPTRLVIFSRPGYVTISSAIPNALVIQVDDGSNNDDIKRFVEEKTVNLAKKTSSIQQIQASLLDRADGVFLWVSLSIKIIEMEISDRAKVLTATSTLKGLDDLYSELLQRVLAQSKSRRDLALRALIWIANSPWPLSKTELVHALSFEPGMASLDSDDIVDEKIILPTCADLVVVKHNRYELLHFSLGEYLRTEYALDLVYSGYIRDEEDEPNAVLARTCMSYLLLAEFQKGAVNTTEAFESLASKHPLLRYSAVHWCWFLQRSMTPRNIDLACDILRTPERRDFIMQAKDFYLNGRDDDCIFPWPGKVQPLHAIACFGLDGLLHRFPQAVSQIDVPDGFSWYPIDYAVKMKQKNIFEWILSQKDVTGDKVITTVPWSYHPSLLVGAAGNDWTDIVFALLAAGFDKDERDQNSSTALHAATYYGNMEIAEVLIKAGADITPRSQYGGTPLMVAALQGQVEMTKLLLDNGASTEVNVQSKNSLSAALHFAACCHKEGAADEIIPLLCDHGADTEIRAKDGCTPLHVAVMKDNTAALRAFLSNGADLSASNAGRTVLHLAALHGKSLVLGFLLRIRETSSSILAHQDDNTRTISATPSTAFDGYHHKPADISLLNVNDNFGKRPIHYAARHGHLECVTYLCDFDPAQINQKSTRGSAPLHIAVQEENLALVNLLLDRGAEANAMSGPKHQEGTPLHLAMHNTKSVIASTLLKKGADPYLRNRFGDTVWDYAARFSNAETVSSLLNHITTLRDENNDLLEAMQSAVSYRNIGIVSMLLSSYGNPRFLSKLEDSKIGLLAAEVGSFEIWKMLVSCHSSLAHASYPNGLNTLHIAAMFGHTDILDNLCGQQPDIDQVDSDGRSPLITAARSLMMGCIKILCDKGARVNHADSYGRSALHYSARSGCRNSVELLLHFGSDMHIRDLAGLCAADYAPSNILALLRGWKGGSSTSKSLGNINGIKEVIAATIKELQSPETIGVTRRLHLDVLGDLLWRFCAYREACLLFGPDRTRRFCDICREEVQLPFYHCTKCLDVDLCSTCRETFVHEKQAGISQLESLELALKPARRALLHASQFGLATLLRIIDSIEGIQMYFQEALRQYSDWTRNYNPEGQLRIYSFPGLLLVLIVHKLKRSESSVEDTKSLEYLAKMDLASGDPESPLRYLYRFRSPVEEVVLFRCCSHTFYRVPSVDELSEEDKVFFQNGGDTPEFLRKLEGTVSSFEANPDHASTECESILAGNKRDIIIFGEDLGDHMKLQSSSTQDQAPAAPFQNTPNSPSPVVPKIDVDQARKTLLRKMRDLQPDDDSLRKGDGMVLETAWSLVQAIVYGDEVHFPSLVELMKTSAE